MGATNDRSCVASQAFDSSHSVLHQCALASTQSRLFISLGKISIRVIIQLMMPLLERSPVPSAAGWPSPYLDRPWENDAGWGGGSSIGYTSISVGGHSWKDYQPDKSC